MAHAAHDLPIVIVGGGIGGAATALALSRRGQASIVLEQAAELREIGAGIQMPPNAFLAFEALGVLDAMRRAAAYPERLVLGDMLSGRPVYQAEIGEAFVSRFGHPYALLHRGDLLETLVAACRASDLVALRPGCCVSGFRDTGDRVLVSTEAGETIEGRALVASDGLWSRTRAALLGDGPPLTDGFVICRGVVPTSEIPEALRSNSVTMWGGPDLDFFHYPVRRSEMYNIGASFRDPTLKPGPGAPSVSRDLLAERFRDACPHVRSLIDHIDVSRAWLLHHRPATERWSFGRVTLLGDAAHPTTIYISQGACMAIEDAVVLAEMVDTRPTIEEALLAYEEARLLRTARVQLASYQFGQIYHAGGAQRLLRNHLLEGRDSSMLCDTLAWVFGGWTAGAGASAPAAA